MLSFHGVGLHPSQGSGTVFTNFCLPPRWTTVEVERLELDIDETIKRDEEERQREQRSHEDQVATLKEKNADYKSELETLLSTPKK